MKSSFLVCLLGLLLFQAILAKPTYATAPPSKPPLPLWKPPKIDKDDIIKVTNGLLNLGAAGLNLAANGFKFANNILTLLYPPGPQSAEFLLFKNMQGSQISELVLTNSNFRGKFCVFPKFEVQPENPLVVSIEADGLTVSKCSLSFGEQTKFELEVELNYRMLSCQSSNELYISFISCGKIQRFKVIRSDDLQRRYVCSSNGDPHIKTFDGLEYGMQARGFFDLVRSSQLIVQVQHVACDTRGEYTCNKRIAVAYLKSYLIFEVDGQGMILCKGVAGQISAVMDSSGLAVSVVLPDSSILSITSFQFCTDFYLNIDLDLIASYRGKVSGLCGNMDLQPDDADSLCRTQSLQIGSTLFGSQQQINAILDGTSRLPCQLSVCAAKCAALSLQKRQLSPGTKNGLLANTGKCETSLTNDFLISTGNKSVDDKINNRMGVVASRNACIADAASGSERELVDGYLKMLQQKASKEVQLLIAANQKVNEPVIAQLKQKFKLV